MAKKPARTFHPMAVVKSLEAQNEAVGLLLARIVAYGIHADTAKPELLREWLKEAAAEAEKVRAIMWPDGDDD